MTQKQYLKTITHEYFETLTPEQKGQFIMEEAGKFASLMIDNARKMKCGDSIKCLGLLQASIIVQKMTKIVPDEEFLNTAKMYIENMTITTNQPAENGE